jgi:hypothetical protein
MGVRVATAIVSYNGTINFGVTADYDTVRDLDVFLSGIETTLGDLGRAVLAEVAGSGKDTPED